MIDRVPRQLDRFQREALAALSRQAEALLNARRAAGGVAMAALARESAWKAATEATTRFGVAFEASPMGMILVDADCCVQRVNRAFAAMVGFEVDQLAGIDGLSLASPR